jgi:hypothetical protein
MPGENNLNGAAAENIKAYRITSELAMAAGGGMRGGVLRR